MAKLKINIKSLAAEARANRKEAAKLSGMEKWELNHHRKEVVRPESRAALLLYAYARSIPRSRLEASARTIFGWERLLLLKRIVQKAKKLGVDHSDFEEWFDE